MKSQLVLVTNGNEDTWPSIEYGVWLAEKMDAPLTLTGIIEVADERHPVEAIFSRAVTLFREKALSYRLNLVNGQTEEVITQMEFAGNELLLLGPLGRPPVRRWLTGRSFYQIMAEVSVPILYVRTARFPTKKILVCYGGLGYALEAQRLGIQIGRLVEAPLTLLHVVPPVDLDYPPAKKIQENWQHLLETDTLPARTLRGALESAEASGIQAEVRVRHGSVVSEILDEIQTGEYDLVCMGSPHSPHSLRHLYMPNVAAEVVKTADCPILIARYSPEFIDQG